MNVGSPFSAETRLLLATASRASGDRELDSLIAGDISWERLLALALHERALPAMWRRLAPVVGDRWPEDAVVAFERAAANRELFLNLLRHRLAEALGALEGAGIEVLLLKGAALAHHGYEEFTARAMADMDLLVEPGDARRAWSLLRDIGWRWRSDRYPEAWYRNMHHRPPLEDAAGTGAVIEVHSAALVSGHGYEFGARDLWRGAREIRVEGRKALVPLPVPHLLHVCVHFAWVHQLGRGGWRTCRDVEVLMEMEGFQWDAFLDVAARSGAERCCYWTLRLVRDLADVAVPERVLTALRPDGLPDAILDLLTRHYAVGLFPTETTCPSVKLQRLLWKVGVRPRLDAREPWPGQRADADVGMRKLMRHVHDAPRWLAYVRGVVGGPDL